MSDSRYTPQPVTVAREPQDEDKYYPMLQRIEQEQMWYTSDIVKMIMRATYRNGTDTASVEQLYADIGVPYESRRGKDAQR